MDQQRINETNNHNISSVSLLTRLIHRKTPKHVIHNILSECAERDFQETITDCFYIRDHIHGRGERDVGRVCFNWIAEHHPIVFLNIMHHIPNYGRWDDLLWISSNTIRPYIYEFFKLQLNMDTYHMKLGLPITTCAKWLPTEGKSFARRYKRQFQQLLSCLGMEPKQYRTLLSSLRSYMAIPEKRLCSGTLYSVKNTSKGFRQLHINCFKFKYPYDMIGRKTISKTNRYEKHGDYYEPVINDLKSSLF